MLSDHPEPELVEQTLRGLIASLDLEKPADQVALIDAAGVLESLGIILPDGLDALQASPEPRVRAVAARILARESDPPADARDRLATLLSDPHPRPRLEAVVACASRPGADSMTLALTALDGGPDKFVDYALSQTVFALESHWLPEAQAGTFQTEKPAHLAYLLETHGGAVAVDLARQALSGSLAPEDRGRLLAVLAKLGGAGEVRTAFAEALKAGDTPLLRSVVESAETRRLAPAPPVEAELKELIADPDPDRRLAALRLAGAWRVASLAGAVETVGRDAKAPLEARTAAVKALSQIRGKAAGETLRAFTSDATTPEPLRRTALEALAMVDLPAAATTLAEGLRDPAGASAATALLPALLSQGGGPGALAAVLEAGPDPDAAMAQEILTAMNRLGRADARLTPLLNRLTGRSSTALAYDAGRVAAIVTAVRTGQGDVKKGAEVFRLAHLACLACHRIGDEGGVIGPSLNGVGAGMPLDQIVESILWPERQIKEGFQAVSFTTTAGATITGYVEREGEDIVWYRNTTTPWIVPLAKKDIASREAIPSLMPAGLTQTITEEQLRDLVAYLASLKG